MQNTTKKTTPRTARKAPKLAAVQAPREGAIAAEPPPGEPLGPYTIQSRIAVAVQNLTLLEWALAGRLDDADELEVFVSPLTEAIVELRRLGEEVIARNVQPRPVEAAAE